MKPDHALLARIKGRCRIDDLNGCWLWTGAMSEGGPAIYGPDLATGKMKIHTGRRLVRQAVTGRAVEPGYRVWGTCGNRCCLNDDHAKEGTQEDYGRWLIETGAFKNNPKRIAANRANAAKRRKINDALSLEIQSSPKTGRQLAAELGVFASTISRHRRGQVVTARGMFSGLIREAA